MSRLLLLLSLLAACVFAQDGVTRGDALRRREYQTYATTNLFVDSEFGSDTNACTASGANACASLTGALAKVPARISNNVTITMTGTFTDTPNIRGFVAGGGALTSTLTVTSSLQAAPVSSTTGSITAIIDQPDDGNDVGYVTDTTKTWTTDELKGYFLEITSGAQSGAVRPIISNTATTVRYIGSFATDPIVGVTYRISRPGAVWASNGIQNITDNSAAITIVGIDQPGNIIAARNFGTVTFSLPRIVTATATSVSLSGGRYTFSSTSASYLSSGTGAGLGLNPVPLSAQTTMLTLGTMFVRTGSTTSNTALLLNRGNIVELASTSTLYAQGAPVSVGTVATNSDFAAVGSSRTNVFIDCTGSGATTGLRSNRLVSTAKPSRISLYTLTLISCATGVNIGNGSSFNLNTTWTSSGVTTDILLDATGYTYSTVNGFSGSFVASPKGTRFSIGSP